uniref:Uncharacterized protein n=1 Tax=Timema poppense TaxID=170557 RepID=A0A7R9DPD1_TIMPO|nr:unnamed protein product [Timema poppensis]
MMGLHPVADLPPPASPVPEPSTDPTPEALHRAPSEMALAHTPVRPSAASPGVSDPRAASSNSSPRGTPVTTRSGRQVIKPQCSDFVYVSLSREGVVWYKDELTLCVLRVSESSSLSQTIVCCRVSESSSLSQTIVCCVSRRAVVCLKRVAWPPPLEDQEIVESQPIYSKGPAFSDPFGPAPVQAATAQPPQSYKPSKVASPPLLAYQPPPATITLRAEPPIHQEQAPVFLSQPAATKGPGSNMRGDEKWPPATVKAQSAAENEARKALAKGPAFRPRKVKKDYSNFFAQNALNPNYPGYRAPPGTQHYTEEGTSDL